MKAVILAGGFGSRMSESTYLVPKPMVEIGGKPILWHIMKIYSSHGINEFVICLGYKAYLIKEWFANYFLHNSDVTLDLENNKMEIHNSFTEKWKVTLVDTGLHTMTGGRIKRIQKYLNNEDFLLTYGDGVSDVDITKTIQKHKESGKVITITAYQPAGRFGALEINDQSAVTNFLEKPSGDGMWINAGFFVCSPGVFDFIPEGDSVIFEKTPLENMAKEGQMNAYKHKGFWKPMDIMRDNKELNDMWDTGDAPWKKW
ncbi:MAG: glucose-1-phosphate cytidylyltransferase [Microcystis aeruginosa Ma_AC_P_19900807_S300]|nr:MAG: glucose-1-phosphate cytidylyltransferase [Microcystis aeruginosa Ma_AC_P_19900807_S300]